MSMENTTSWLYVFAGLTPWVQVSIAALFVFQGMGLVFLLREIFAGSKPITVFVYLVEKERSPEIN